jgi:hypothetical protein
MTNLYKEVLPEAIEVNPVAKPIKKVVNEYKKVRTEIQQASRKALVNKEKITFEMIGELEGRARGSFRRLDNITERFTKLLTEGSFQSGQDIADGFIKAQQTVINEVGESVLLFDLKPHERALYQQQLNDIKTKVLREVKMLNQQLRDNFDDVIRQGMVKGSSMRLTDEAKDVGTQLYNKIEDEGLVLKDSIGRNWKPETYVRMYSRTRSREIQTEAIENRMNDYDLDLVQISAHLDVDGMDICNEYEGNVYNLSGNDSKYPRIDIKPPFHPNCCHVMTPWIKKYHESMGGREDEVGKYTTTPQRNKYVNEE